MKTAGLIVGIVGGVLGFIMSVLIMLAGGFISVIGDDEGESVAGKGLVVALASLVGLAGAAFSMSKPVMAAVIMALGGVVGFGMVVATVGFNAGAIFLGIGNILLVVAAFMVFKQASSESASAE